LLLPGDMRAAEKALATALPEMLKLAIAAIGTVTGNITFAILRQVQRNDCSACRWRSLLSSFLRANQPERL